MDNASVLTAIVHSLLSLNKANLSSDEVQYLDARSFDDVELKARFGPLVKTINDTLRVMEKRAENRLKAERRRIKREIECKVREQSRADIEETLAGAYMGIWSIELEEGCEPRMYGDKTMHTLLGIEDMELTPEEIYNAWYDRIENGYCDMVRESVVAMEQGRHAEVVYPWNHPKIGQIYVRCGGVKDNFDKPGFRLKGYHQDVTETMRMRKRQERAMFDAIVEAKKANAAKTEFISNMSHDIRTPINGILGMVAIAEKNVDDKVMQAECRRKVRMAAEHLSSLINDVLDISKIESGTMAISCEAFNIHELIDNSMTIVGPQAEESAITLRRDYSDIVHPLLMGSPLHLRQVIINVIGNGIKYNKPGGYVSIHTQEVDSMLLTAGERRGQWACNNKMAARGQGAVGSERRGGHTYKTRDGDSGAAQEEGEERKETALYRFTIEDNGIGMSSEFLQHLFEPFTQEGKDARTNYRGTGLGMAITKGLVEQMGGTIEVHSKSDEGTKIIIQLPFVVCEQKEQDAAGALHDEKKNNNGNIEGMTILLAEDNDLNREIAEYMLKDAGAVVIDAVDGKEAYELFLHSADKIDCILMDVMMPVMDGLESTKKIRASGATGANVPIIVLSANAFTEDTQKAREAGANAYLTKPLDTQKMLQAIASFRHTDEGLVPMMELSE